MVLRDVDIPEDGSVLWAVGYWMNRPEWEELDAGLVNARTASINSPTLVSTSVAPGISATSPSQTGQVGEVDWTVT